MNVSELFAALDVDLPEARAIGQGMGLAAWDLPRDLADARSRIASLAEERFAERALHELVERAMPTATLLRMLRQTWNGARADYALRSNVPFNSDDPKLRRLAGQLAAAWNSPETLDQRMNAGLAREIFRPLRPAHDSSLSRREPGDLPVTAAHAPRWWKETYFQVTPSGEPPEGLSLVSRQLFEHQQTSIDKLTSWWRSPERRAGVLCLPTGGGKTRTAVRFVLSEALKKDKIIWLTHREELMNQAIGTFIESAADAAAPFTLGRFAAGQFKVQAPVDVLVASIPTLAHKRHERLHHLDQVLRRQGSFGLIVVDECHHGTARTWKRLINELQARCPEIKLLGLSATPTRSAKNEQPAFWNLFDSIVHEAHLLDLIQRRVLAEPKVETINTGLEFSATLKEKADFQHFHDLPVSLVNRICEDEGRNNQVVANFVERKDEWGTTLIFAATVEQGRFITRRLRESGVSADEVYGDTPAARRQQVVDRFRRKEIQAVVNVGLFTEGTDLPRVQTVFMARPTRSKILFRQMVGRGLRGPKIGGSRECKVVAFFDEVSGLVKENLASSFHDERDAAVALGIAVAPVGEEEADAAEEVTHEQPMSEEIDDIAGMEAELRNLLRQRLEVEGGSVTCALRGWWEAVRGGRRAFVPVFDDVAEAIHAFVTALPANVDTTTASEELLLPESVLSRFLSIARRPGVEPRFVDLEEATPEEVQAVLDDVAAITNSGPDDAELAWTQSKSEAPEGQRFAVLVDGQFEGVQAKSLWRLRKEWDHYAIDFGIKDRPDLAPALAQLLAVKAANAGVDDADAMAILDAASDHQEFPTAHKTPPKADVPSLVKALERAEESEWSGVVDKAWANGLSESFQTKSDLLIEAISHVARAA